tara:strand:- start:6016 stop:7413 length:1398 start_codon:yes stop_codon:yes gene_type:complete
MEIDWNKRIDEFCNRKENSSIGWIDLLEMVENQIAVNNITPDLHKSNKELLEVLDKYYEVSDYNILSEAKKKLSPGEKLILSLPKFTPSEQWGDSKSEARKEIKKFIENIRGKTVAEKFEFLMAIQRPDSGIRSTRRIISSIILLESLKAMLESYGAPTAGFIFEGYIAALMNGEQVTDPPEGSLPIEDVMAFTYEGSRPGIPLSLKLLKKDGDTKGSFKNLVDSLYRRGSKGMGYLVVFKESDTGESVPKGGSVMQLRLKEFTFTNKNMVPILAEGAPKNIKLFKPNRALMKSLAFRAREARKDRLAEYALRFSRAKRDMSQEVMNAYADLNASDYYLLLQATEGYSRERDNNKGKKPNVTEAAGETPTQFYIYETYFRDNSGGVIEHGVIEISDKAILNTVNFYTDVLQESITTLFNAVASLNENINEYFVSSRRDKAIRRGKAAISDTEEIKGALDTEIGSN